MNLLATLLGEQTTAAMKPTRPTNATQGESTNSVFSGGPAQKWMEFIGMIAEQQKLDESSCSL